MGKKIKEMTTMRYAYYINFCQAVPTNIDSYNCANSGNAYQIDTTNKQCALIGANPVVTSGMKEVYNITIEHK